MVNILFGPRSRPVCGHLMKLKWQPQPKLWQCPQKSELRSLRRLFDPPQSTGARVRAGKVSTMNWWQPTMATRRSANNHTACVGLGSRSSNRCRCRSRSRSTECVVVIRRWIGRCLYDTILFSSRARRKSRNGKERELPALSFSWYSGMEYNKIKAN